MLAWSDGDGQSTLRKAPGENDLACIDATLDVGAAASSRMQSLERYDVLDTPGEEAFDRITRLVCHVLSVPTSTVTFLDGHRQWFKSRQGLDVAETGRDVSFCKIPIAEGRPLIVTDALADP